MTSQAQPASTRRQQPATRLVWLGVGILAAGVAMAVPTPSGLSPEGQRALAIILLATVLWSTEALPLAATGLGCVALLSVTGATGSLSEALSGFSRPVPYFLFGVLVLGFAAGRSGLAERVARWFLALARNRPTALYWQLVCSFAALAFVLPSASTRTGIQLPVYHEALQLMKLGPGSRLATAVMHALAQLNRLASTALLTGGITPVTAAALIGGLGWGKWFVLMSVPMYANLVLGGLAVYLANRPFETPRMDANAAVSSSSIGGASAAEMRTCGILLGVSFLWLTDSWHHLDPALPALFGAILLVTPGIGTLAWSEVEKGVGLSMVFVLACSISLADAVVGTGAAAWLGSWLVGWLQPFADMPLLMVTLLLVASLVARVMLSSITAYLTVLIPLVTALAQAVGLNPLPCCLLVTLVGDSVVYYAAQAPSSLLSFQYKYLTARDILWFGFAMTFIAMGVALFVALPYWAWLGEPLVLPR